MTKWTTSIRGEARTPWDGEGDLATLLPMTYSWKSVLKKSTMRTSSKCHRVDFYSHAPLLVIDFPFYVSNNLRRTCWDSRKGLLNKNLPSEINHTMSLSKHDENGKLPRHNQQERSVFSQLVISFKIEQKRFFMSRSNIFQVLYINSGCFLSSIM